MTVASEVVLYAGSLPAAPYRELVDAAASAGFDAISLWPLTYRRAISREGLDPPAMRRLAEEAGLRIAALEACGDWLPAIDQADVPAPLRAEWTRDQFFAAAAELGVDTLVAADVIDRDVDVEQAVEGFAGLCDDAARHGVRVALEFVPFGGIRDLRTAMSVLSGANRPASGLVIDVCHLVRGGWDEAALRSIPADRIFAVQLADGPRQPPPNLRDEAMYHRQLPGTGSFDVAAILAVLAEMGVHAPVGPELYRDSSTAQSPATVAAELMSATRSVLDSSRGSTS